MSYKKKSPAVNLRRSNPNLDKPVMLSTGVWAMLRPVTPATISEAQAEIQDPPVPTIYLEDKDRHEENPNDPAYLKALERADQERVMVAMDAMIMMGIDLVDEEGDPLEIDDGPWLKKLRLMHKRKMVNLDDYNLEDGIEREFLYKRYVAVGVQDIALISAASGLTEEDIAKAERTFPTTA